jgi:hypothetical protein
VEGFADGDEGTGDEGAKNKHLGTAALGRRAPLEDEMLGLSMRIAIVIGFTLPVLGAGSGEKDTKVSGIVSVLTDVPERVKGAKVWFLRSDGQTVEATANEVGEYEVLLRPGYDYTVTAGSKQLCEIHRPPFRAEPGVNLRFDFTTTICGIIDRTVSVPSGLKPNDNRPYYRPYYRSSYDKRAPYWFFEEGIAFGKEKDQWLVIAFGAREGDKEIRYGPFHFGEYPTKSVLPVAIRFDTYTVQADAAVLDPKARTLRAEGNVSVADGGSSPPHAASCVVLRLDDAKLRLRTCQGEGDSKRMTD